MSAPYLGKPKTMLHHGFSMEETMNASPHPTNHRAMCPSSSEMKDGSIVLCWSSRVDQLPPAAYRGAV